MDGMSSQHDKKRRNKKRIRNLAIDLATFFVIAVVAIIIFVVVGQQEQQSDPPQTDLEITGIHCERTGKDNIYFVDKAEPDSGKHEISANFHNDKLMDLMYSFTGEFPTDTDMDLAKAVALANFDLDLGNKYVHADNAWSETISKVSDTAIKLSVYSEGKYLQPAGSRAFDLGEDTTFPTTLKGIKSAYEARGYTCKKNN